MSNYSKEHNYSMNRSNTAELNWLESGLLAISPSSVDVLPDEAVVALY